MRKRNLTDVFIRQAENSPKWECGKIIAVKDKNTKYERLILLEVDTYEQAIAWLQSTYPEPTVLPNIENGTLKWKS